MPKQFSTEGIDEMRQERSPLLVEVRNLLRRIAKLEGIIMAPKQYGGVNPSGNAMRLYSDYVLSSSGNTVTCAPSESKMVSVYAEGIGWINKTIEASFTFDATGSTSNRLYDLFISWGVDDLPVITSVVWNSSDVRISSLDTVDGVRVLASDYAQRYIGTARYNGSTMLLQRDDGTGERFWGTGDPRNNGSDPATGVGIYASGVTLSSIVYNFFTILNGVVGFGVDLSGNLRAIAGGFKLNSTEMSLTISGNMVMQITSSYALFGSNVSSPNTTAFSIFFTAQTYNSESMEAGSIMLGDNSSGIGNIFWKPSLKKFQIRGANTYVSNEKFISFLDSGGSANSGIYCASSDDLALVNNKAGKAINFSMATTSGTPTLKWAEDPSAADVSELTVPAGPASRGKVTLGAGVAINEAQGTNIASAATTDIGVAAGNYVKVTGTTTITALGTIQAGTRRIVEFTGVLTLTHNATSLILPGAANITTAAGDVGVFVSLGSGNWKCISYQQDANAPISASGTSFTPTVIGTTTAGAGTYTTQLGSYAVIGKIVFFEISLVWTAHTGTGNLRVGGLPFTAANNGINPACALFFSNLTLSTATNKVETTVIPNTTQINVFEVAGAGATALPIDTAATIHVAGWYLAA